MTVATKAGAQGAVEDGDKAPPPRRLPAWGEPAPFFTAESDVNPTFAFNTVAGRWVVLAFFGSLEPPATSAAHAQARASAHLFNDEDACFFGILVDQQPAPRSGAGYRYFRDRDFAVSRLYGVTDGQRYAPMVFLLDPALRVVAVQPITGMDEILRTLETMIAAEPASGVEGQAPVLTVPRVLEPGLCAELIALYRTVGGAPSGFMREVNGMTRLLHDENHKRRSDVNIEDEALRTRIRQRINVRLGPMIERAFGWKATRMERYLIARYADEEQGFFRAHRDNTTAGTAHRKFAVSINLNADYDGGLLRFPEFGRRTYKPPVGGATVFSCSLLHEATPVTRGERFVFVPFLYDEAGARVREANLDKVQLEPQRD